MGGLNEFVIKYKETIAILISIFGIIIPFYSYLNAKRIEQKHKNFENFHEKMIRKISNQGGVAGLDEQVAVIFDLRKFPKYYSVSKRILTDLIEWWKPQLGDKPHFKRLINEAGLTLQFIDKNYFKRLFASLFNKY